MNEQVETQANEKKGFFKTLGKMFKENTWQMIFIIALTFFLTLIFFGGNSGGEKADSNAPAKKNSTVESAAVKEYGEEGNLGGYYVKIGNSFLAKDYENKDVIIIEYEYTNNGDEATPFWTALSDIAFQNGLQLDKAYVLASSYKYDLDLGYKEVQPGTTITVPCAYILNDTSSSVTVEVSEFISLSSDKLTKTFDIA